MSEKKKELELWLTCIILEGFLLYGEIWTAVTSTWPGTEKWLEYWLSLMYVLMLVKLAIQRKNWLEWLVTAGLLCLVEMTRITTQTDAVLWFVTGVLIAKDVDLRRVLKADLLTRLVMGAALIALPLAGLYPFFTKHMGNGRFRYNFGWSHPNEMGLFFLMLCMAWLYVRHEKWSWKDNTGMLFLLMFLDCLPNSRTAEVSILILLLLENLSCYLKKRKITPSRRVKLWKMLAFISVFSCCILSFLLFTNYNKAIVIQYLPLTVIDRLRLAYQFWNENGFSFWGQFFDSTTYNYLDMLYAYLSMNMGMAVMALVLCLNVLTIWHAGKEQNEGALLILISFQAYSLLEHEHFKILYSFYPLLLGYGLWPTIIEIEARLRRLVRYHVLEYQGAMGKQKKL
ncbi:MAG: hypothetical protein LUH55_05240 [Bacteroides thetaiotaomicron]|nr:hypothetical protein [Bacteroides thetaiotaomicron]